MQRALHAADARSRGGALVGRGLAGVEDAGEQQIPFGNDNKKGKNKNKSKNKSKGSGVADD